MPGRGCSASRSPAATARAPRRRWKRRNFSRRSSTKRCARSPWCNGSASRPACSPASSNCNAWNSGATAAWANSPPVASRCARSSRNGWPCSRSSSPCTRKRRCPKNSHRSRRRTPPKATRTARKASRRARRAGRLAPTSREDAYRQLLLIADYLARTEPHSPVPYLIKRAVEWGNKPLSELLAELINADSEARRVWSLLGVLP